ncbi:hypothetical protein MTR67_020372 [Solanum verrucosum]|uniref:Glycosyltransferase n=1 Tax=Solanum verrucosum TaxID=315347 RepID=A0AAF0QQH7_SOLVR|nr:hypothetical protein MTR67_020372 [Solanum verrucosum]
MDSIRSMHELDKPHAVCIPYPAQGPFKELLAKLNNTCSSNVPPVSCIVSDGCMSFTLAAAQELGIPEIFFWTPSACGLLDASDLTNGYLETALDWIPGMKGIRLRDLPTLLRSTNPDDFLFNYLIQETDRSKLASAIVINTFDPLEKEVLETLQALLSPVYTIGPLHFLLKHIEDRNLECLGSNLWKEEPKTVEWLDSKKPNSVVYVNFGSITVMTANQLTEFAWGLANSQMDFLWIIRPDTVSGEKATLPSEFMEETKERGMLTSWCAQEQVLSHPAIGGFLTHSGWNSTLESISNGVPMICWPFFTEQQTNCWFKCTQWGIGMEIDNNVKRDEVERLVRDLMVGEKGKDMKKKAMEWKKLAEEAAAKSTGSSYVNIDKLINEILLKH